MTKIYAEDCNYFQTSKSSPDKWIELTKSQIKSLGGRVTAEGFGSDGDGRAAFMIGFQIGEDRFKVVWPVLPSRKGNNVAAKIQAATQIYHYCKSVCLFAVVVGARAAFFSHLVLPDGRTASQLAAPELAENVPGMLLLGSGR